MPCRICTTNDREGLIEQLAEEIWNTQRSADQADEWDPWEQTSPYWQMVFRGHAAAVLKLALGEHAHDG